MREGAKRRLAGGAVIVVLAVIFLPMLFDSKLPVSPEPSSPPSEPEFDSRFATSGAGDSVPDSGVASGKTPLSSGLGGILDRDLHQADPGQPGQIRQGDPTRPGLVSEPSRLGAVSEPPRREPTEPFAQDEEEPLQPAITPPPPARTQTQSAAKPASVRAPVKTQPPTAKPAKPVQPVQKSAQQPKKAPKQPEEPRKNREKKDQKEQKVATTVKEKGVASASPEPRRPTTDGNASWVVQVASLGASEAAAELQQKLRGAGYSSFVEKAEVRGKTYYRVRVGPNGDRASAERTAATLRQRQKLDTIVQRQSDTAKSPRD